MIRLGKQQEIDDYFSSDNINQSFLKLLLSGVEFLKQDEKTLFYEEKGHFIIGSGVDMKLTQEKEAYDSVYHTFKGKKPSDTVLSIVHQVFDNAHIDDIPPDMELIDYHQLIIESCNNHNYCSKMGDAIRVGRVVEAARDYFLELTQAVGKQIVSTVEDNLINNIKMSLTTSEYTHRYFKDSPDIDIFYQVPIYFEYNGVKCKALLDMLILNRKKRVAQAIDIKTLGDSVKNFPFSVKRRGYNLQGSFYQYGLEKLSFGKATTPIKEIGDLKDYQILPFKFLVETTEYKENKITGEINYYQGKPLAFILSEQQMNIGRYGRPELVIIGSNEDKVYPITFPEIRGFHQAIELYKWYEENTYDWDKEVQETEGNILIK